MITQQFNGFWKKLREIISMPIMTVLPGQLAFYFVLSLIPLIYLVGLIGSLLSLSVQNFIDFINASFPAATSNLIIPLIEGQGLDFKVLLFIFSAFLLASNGIHSVIVTSNILYGLKNAHPIKRRIKAIFLTILLVILLGFIIIVPAFGNYILLGIRNLDFVKPFYSEMIQVFRLAEIPLSFLFIYFNIKLIYTIAPGKEIRSKDSTYGAIFTTFFWIIITKFYSYYVTTFTAYDIFYGSIANLIILLLWIYILSYIFVVGLALNASKEQIKNNKKNNLVNNNNGYMKLVP